MRVEITTHTFQENDVVIGEKRFPYKKGGFFQWQIAYLTQDRKIVVLNLFERIYRCLGGFKETHRKNVWAALGQGCSCPNKKDFRIRIQEIVVQNLHEIPKNSSSHENIPPQESPPQQEDIESQNTDSSQDRKIISDVDFKKMMELLKKNECKDTHFSRVLDSFTCMIKQELSDEQTKEIRKIASPMAGNSETKEKWSFFCKKKLNEEQNPTAFLVLLEESKFLLEVEMKHVHKAIDHADQGLLDTIFWRVIYFGEKTNNRATESNLSSVAKKYEEVSEKILEIADKKNFLFGRAVRTINRMKDHKLVDDQQIEEGIQYLSKLYKTKFIQFPYLVQRFLLMIKTQLSYDQLVQAMFASFKEMIEEKTRKNSGFLNLCILCLIQKSNEKNYDKIWETITQFSKHKNLDVIFSVFSKDIQRDKLLSGEEVLSLVKELKKSLGAG